MTLLAVWQEGAFGKVSPRNCLLKNVSYLLANLLEIISLTLRDHGVRVNCPAKMWETGDTY